ncbi:MAG: anti-CBASS Acb1 family protein [Pseudomonadota bacterium]|nr:anti-CBASS Acb1 family protein [Pseudomonadota bacterium]
MGVVTNLRDGLINALSGRGTSIDRSRHTAWFFRQLPPDQLLAAYRSSWLISKIVGLPPMDMVREWREWEADEADTKRIEAEEARLRLPRAVFEGLEFGRLGGGAVLLGTNAQNLAEPVRPGERLVYVKALSRRRLTPGLIDYDPRSTTFDEPEYFTLSGQRGSDQIHPSRLLIFRGERVPDILGGQSADDWWGDSVIDRVDRAVKDAQRVSEGYADLVEEAKLDIYRIAGMTERLLSPGGEEAMRKRFEATALGKSNYRGIFLDKEDEWDQRQLTWAGMPEMVRTYLAIVAGAADIPATRLLGKAPDGQNATGEHDEKNYRSMIATRQGMELRPQLAKLDAILLPSLGLAPDLYWKFSPLDVPDEETRSKIDKADAETAQIYANSGLVPSPALEKGVQSKLIEKRTFPGLKDALDELPDLEPGEGDEGDFLTEEERRAKGGDQQVSAGGGPDVPVRRAANDARFLEDAAPKTLYVQRKLLNADELIRWAKSQGLETTLAADDMHVTIACSRAPVDWFAVGTDWSGDENGHVRVRPGGPRSVERLGDGDAIALMFVDDQLEWRHNRIREAGASWDWPDYRPHVTLTWQAEGVDVSQIEPYTGPLVFGPELFSEVDEGWKPKIEEA